MNWSSMKISSSKFIGKTLIIPIGELDTREWLCLTIARDDGKV